MDCNIIKDLIPLYIDGCCSKESEKAVKEHIANCTVCKKLYSDMKTPSAMSELPEAPKTFSKLNDWKASVLQSALLFISFALITVGVALESKTPVGLMNSFWALNIVIPSTGFMLSLANWYFVKVYKTKKSFSYFSMMMTFVITLCAYVWAFLHYETTLIEALRSLFTFNMIGTSLTVLFCTLSVKLSDIYAKMLGKE